MLKCTRPATREGNGEGVQEGDTRMTQRERVMGDTGEGTHGEGSV